MSNERGMAALCAVAVVASASVATVTGFVNNAAGNSIDMANFAATLGASIEHGVNFDTHGIGAVNPNFYAGSHGVTLATSGWDAVDVGLGATSGSTNGPNSSGEGHLDVATGYLATTDHPSSVTATFASGVYAAGFMTIDYYNPFGDNTMTIEAFDGVNGTGTLLGSYTGLGFNFQLNFKYFMGIGSDAANIRSVRLTHAGLYSDGVVIDEIAFSVPGPGAMGVLGLGAIAGLRRRR